MNDQGQITMKTEDHASQPDRPSEATKDAHEIEMAILPSTIAKPPEPAGVQQTPVPSPETEERFPTGMRFKFLTISLMLVVFIVALDTTILATAVPSITTQFHSISDIGWYNGAYLVPLMALQPTFGKVFSLFNIKYILLVALLVFEAGSLTCALAPSSPVFILGRAISGLGAAAIYGGSTTLIQLVVPLSKIPMYFSILTSVFTVANLAGPPVGGLFTSSHRLTWRFCYYINLPFGALAVVLMLFAFKEADRELPKISFQEKLFKMDLGGLQIGGNTVPWSSPKAWGLLLGFGLLLTLFIALQIYLGENATIPPRIYLNRSVALAQIIAICMMLGINTHTYYLPFYFQSAKSLSPSASGIRLLPYTLSVTASELTVGFAVSKFGVYQPFMIFGTAIYTIAAGLFCKLQIQTPVAHLIGYQVMAGFGFGASLQLCATVLRASVDAEDIPIAGAMIAFAPFFGNSLAAGIGQNVFRTALTAKLLQYVSPAQAAIIVQAGATGGVDVVTGNVMEGVLESYDYAVRKVFVECAVVGGIAFLGTVSLKWQNIKNMPKI